MSTSLRSKISALAAIALFAMVPVVHAAGPITNITILGLSSNPTFTAGITTNTPTTTIFINCFGAGSSTPDAGETVQLQLLSDGAVIPNGISPSSFTTTGTGILNGGNASLPITFYRAGSAIQLRAIAAGETETSSTFNVSASSATKLLIIGPGQTHVPGTNPLLTTGRTGTFSPQEPNQAFSVTVLLTDNQFNRVSANHTISFTSGDLTIPPATGALSGGTGDFSMTITGPSTTRTLVATDDTDPAVQAGSLEVTTAGPPSKEVFPFPSPFNPTQRDITFRFRLSEPKSVKLTVVTPFGEQVWSREVSGNVGFTDVTWNGRNEKGEIVAAGVYYSLLEVDGSIESKKRFGVIK